MIIPAIWFFTHIHIHVLMFVFQGQQTKLCTYLFVSEMLRNYSFICKDRHESSVVGGLTSGYSVYRDDRRTDAKDGWEHGHQRWTDRRMPETNRQTNAKLILSLYTGTKQ